MKFAYSFGGNLYDGGMGYIASWGLDEIVRRGLIAKAFNIYSRRKGERPEWMKNHAALALFYRTVEKTARRLGYTLPPDFADIVLFRLFDKVVSWRLPDVDSIYCWHSMALETMRMARHRGIGTVLENPCAHRKVWDQTVQEELDLLGLSGRATSPSVLERDIAEYDQADRIVVPSLIAKQSFIDCGVEEERLVHLPYGVDTARFFPPEKRDDDVFRVLFVGEVGVRKGPLYLLKAWDKLNLHNAELRLIGPVRDEFRMVAGKLLHRPDIKAEGFDPKSERWYRRSDILVLPSIEEGFGMVVTEAMASGMPVVVSENVGASDVVADGKNGYVFPVRDVDAIAEKIETLYRDHELRREMGRQALNTARANRWDTYSSGVVDALSAVARKG
ncbi:MAG: glycosyltransferase family 4 protein [Planctomycetes bacterium]|nr:glycosyltransferase family 4 protein [Planctomycetota bacterium]